MAQRFAGIAFLVVDGNQIALRGNFTVSPSAVERTMIAGQDAVHGYQELPRVPYIEGDISMLPGINVEDLLRQTDSTVLAQLANGKQYSLQNATCKGGFDLNTRDGQFRCRWEGIVCHEMATGGAAAPF
jgi:Phage tail tube protein